jgi:hypothetical protein
MSADNMVYLQHCRDGKWRAWHGFSSDYEDESKPKAKPKSGFIVEADSREAAIVAAHDWTTQNYTEYGIVELEPEHPDCADKSSLQEESGVAVGGVELPELPKGDCPIWSEYERADGVSVVVDRHHSADQMREYGQSCYAAGVAAGMEKAARLCEQMGDAPDGSSEGYERACAIVIRAQTYPTKEQQVG